MVEAHGKTLYRYDNPGARKSSNRSISTILQISIPIILLFLIFIRIMNFEIRKDEQLYVPPARLLDHLQLYRDMFYNHPPGAAWYFHAVDKLTGSEFLLLSGRVGVFTMWAVFICAMMTVSFLLTRSILVSGCICCLTVVNDLLLAQTGMTATNNFMPLSLCYVGLALFILSVYGRYPKPVLTGLAGGVMGLAVCTKISAVAFIPPMAVAAFFLPSHIDFTKRLAAVVVPLAVGGLLGGLPILIQLASNPELFLAHIVRYHTGPHLQYWTLGVSGEAAVMSLVDKMLLGWQIWFGTGISIAIAATLIMVLLIIRQDNGFRILAASSLARPLIVVVGSLTCSIALCFIPTPSFPQYFAPPLACFPLIMALLYTHLDAEGRSLSRVVLLGCGAVVVLTSLPRLAQYVPAVAEPHRWTVMTVHAAGSRISERMKAAGVDGKVATLYPVYPLEGGLEVYPELATGPFAYRTGDLTATDLAAFYKMTSLSKIVTMLENDPPAAILLGFDPPLEAPMLSFAIRNDYLAIQDLDLPGRTGPATLYVRQR